MSSLAVLILTFNEEENIRECLQSVSFADEKIVIDSGSTDKTIEIAHECGARVVVHPMTEGFAEQRNFALTQTTTDWVLYLDADERITEELGIEIKKLIETADDTAFEILRQNIVIGQKVKHGGHQPDWSLRLYPRTAIHWQGLVHEQAIVSVPIKQTQYPMNHFTYQTWEQYFEKANHYTTLMALDKYNKGTRVNLLDLLLRPPMGFIKMYFFKKGFSDGKLGLILALLHGVYTFIKYLKLYQLGKNRAT